MLLNIRLILYCNFLFSFLILMPVMVPFFESKGLNMQNVYELQAIFSLGVLLFEIPSGYISDLLGRKKILILAAIAQGIGFTLFNFSDNFFHLVVAEIFISLAVSLFSGSDVSLIYDSLEASNAGKSPIKILGKRVFYMQSGEATAGLVGGWLILWSMEIAVIAQAIVAWLTIIPALFLVEPPRAKMDKKKHKENFIYIFKALFQHSNLLTLIILCSIFYGVATLLAVWVFQKYWRELGVPLIYFGYIWAATNITVAIVGRYAHKIEKKIGSSWSLVLIGVLPIIGYFGMANSFVIAGITFCFCFQVARGIVYVVLTDGLNKRISGELRATANSISSLGVRGIFIVFGPLVGYLIDSRGLQLSLNVLGVFYVICFLLLIIPLLKQRSNYQEIK